MFAVEKNVLRPLNQNQLSNGTRDRSNKNCLTSSSMVPKGVVNPVIKCTTCFKRSYIELDDEMISVITDIEGNLMLKCFYIFIKICYYD